MTHHFVLVKMWRVLLVIVFAVHLEGTDGFLHLLWGRRPHNKKGSIRKQGLLGCFEDSRNRVLSGGRTWGNHMTVNHCRNRCVKEKTQFYGLEVGKECFCGNSMRYKNRKPLSDCRMKCKGSRAACGGAWRILIYRNPNYQSSGFVPTTGFVGCYKDGWYRTLGGAYRYSRYMTINRCRNICKRRRNRYAGVERGVNCFCGNCLRRKNKLANSQCNVPCGGNKKEGCGGRWRIAIYKTNVKRGNNCGRHSKCHSNARCINGECRCNRGYTGDGVKRCYQTCTCSASGDPHYKTYDGQMIHFMGICKYTLTKVKNSRSNEFNVEVKNEHRGSSRSVSYTRLVDVKLGKNTIRLHKKHQVYLNGLRIFLPYTSRGEFRIFRSGNKVKVIASTNDGDAVVTWDGWSSVTVTVPKDLGRRMIGLCGDCNEKKDDFRTKYGKDVSGDRNKFTEIGNSYTVKDDTDQIHQSCKAHEVPNKCTPELRKKAMDIKVCGFLNPEKKDQSPFRDCLAESPTTSKEMFENCVFDFCTYYSETSRRERTICQSVNGYAEYCAGLGISVKWRSSDFCPLPCGDNMVYDSEMSGCPASCVDPDSEKDCDQPPTEGCRCKEGFILSDNKCVEKSKCGCKGADSKYYPLGETYTSSDCTTVQECKLEGGSVGFKTIQTKPKCGQHQTCSVSNGAPTCVCQKGYISDGKDGCLEETPACNSKKADVKCESSNGNKVVCTVPKAQAVLHVRSTASDCKYGSTYGFSGDGIWVSLACKGTFSVCYLPVPSAPGPECLAHDDPHGKKYQGTMSSTESGYTCQKWSSQTPHAHSLLKTLDNNHCRNPDNEKAAWCYTTDSKKRWDYCHIPVCPGTGVKPANVDECLDAGDPKGLKYKGNRNTTKSGKACQDWGRQRPHSHSFQKLADQTNFCRNPDNEAAPWCYTTSSATRWEFCNIPDCGECEIKQERNLQCEIVYKVVGKCYFASSALSNCKFTVRLNKYRSGESEARILKDGKAHILRSGDTHKSCASFEMRSNTLYVVEKLCEEKCTKPPVILH
ncbi:zonadhesin-like [Saccostrea cucullata]|uniref:zonadhesin-like n=1 Tax=Saccostrea cuccullata TaxID=36930 RepID=UPI002ED08FC6